MSGPALAVVLEKEKESAKVSAAVWALESGPE